MLKVCSKGKAPAALPEFLFLKFVDTYSGQCDSSRRGPPLILLSQILHLKVCVGEKRTSQLVKTGRTGSEPSGVFETRM